MPHYRVGRLITALALVFIAAATLFPAAGGPARFPILCITCGELGAVDNVLNVLLFLPFGIGLRLSGIGRSRALLIALGTTIAIETSQLALIRGRDASVGDIVMNTVGALIGIALADRRHVVLHPTARQAARLLVVATLAWWAVVVFAGWALRPDFPPGQYRAALAPDLRDIELFEGGVSDVAFNGTPIAGRGVDSASDVIAARAPDGGVEVRARVELSGPTFGIAPIVAVGPADHALAIVLGQNGTDLEFRVRLRAERLRLRVPSVALPAGRAAAGPNREPLAVTGRMPDVGHLRLESMGRRGRATAELVLNPYEGWWLIMPLHITHPAAIALATVAWVAAMLFPIGYWSAAVFRRSRARAARAAAAGIVAVAVVVGLKVLPRLLGYPPADAPLWAACAAGLGAGALGSVIAHRTRSAVRTPAPTVPS